MPKRHWRDFSDDLRAKLTAKDISKTEIMYKEWEERRRKDREALGMTETQYTKYMSDLCSNIFGSTEDDINDTLPR